MQVVASMSVATALLIVNLISKCGAGGLALRLNERLLLLAPSMAGLLSLNLASLHSASGNADKAIDVLQKHRETVHDTTPFDLGIARALEVAGRYEESRTVYERILANDTELGADFRAALLNHVDRLRKLAARPE